MLPEEVKGDYHTVVRLAGSLAQALKSSLNVLKLIKPNCGVSNAFKIVQAKEEKGASACLVAQAAPEEVIFQGKRTAE